MAMRLYIRVAHIFATHLTSVRFSLASMVKHYCSTRMQQMLSHGHRALCSYIQITTILLCLLLVQSGLAVSTNPGVTSTQYSNASHRAVGSDIAHYTSGHSALSTPGAAQDNTSYVAWQQCASEWSTWSVQNSAYGGAWGSWTTYQTTMSTEWTLGTGDV
jgi:hypothetical protein